MPVEINLRPDLPFFDLLAELDAVTYTLQVRWNPRTQGYYLDLLDEQGETTLLGSLHMVASWPLASYTADRTPPGALVIVDTSGEGDEPSARMVPQVSTSRGGTILSAAFQSTLGVRHKLLYYSAAELGLA